MQEMNFSDPVKLNAIRYREKKAITFRDKAFTYEEFNQRINQLSFALQDKGIKNGDKVAFMLFNCNELFETIYACSKIGAVFIPINSRFISREITHILNNSEAKILIYDSRFSSEVQSALSNQDSVRHLISIGEKDETAEEYETLIGSYPVTEPTPEAPISENDMICCLYTGGTTGLPKGAMHTHRSMYMVGLLFSIEFSISRGGKGLVAGPLYGAAALSISMPNFFVGNPVHILESFHPLEVLKAIDKEKITTTFLAPPMLDAIFALPEEISSTFDVSSVKSIISVGAPLLSGTKERTLALFKDVELNEFYGASEHGGSANLFPEYMNDKERSVGLPMLGMEIKILDETGDEVEQGEVGEIYVKGLTLCKGYYKNEQATNEAYKNGWFGLGDMAKQDEEGFYYLVDRKQDMILSGAINVYPAEIEGVLYEYPKVREATVIGIPDEKWGEVPMALIVPKEGESITTEEMLDFCEGKLAKYKTPKEFIFRETPLPRSLQGKVLKYKLREQFITN